MEQQDQNDTSKLFRELRQRAEEILSSREGLENEPNRLDVKRLLNELQVNQFEMEIQNDELRQTQVQLAAEREKYADLYNFAPAPYFTFNDQGVIIELNLSAADLLGTTRKYLVNHPIAPFLSPDSMQVFVQHIKQVLTSKNPQTCELTIRPHEGKHVFVHVHSVALQSEDSEPLLRSVMSNITEQKQDENIQNARLRIIEFASENSLDALLQSALDELCSLTDSPIGFFHFVEPDQRTLSLQAWSTRTLEEMCTAEGKGHHYNIDEAGVWVDCVREHRPVIHNDYACLPHRKGLPEGHAPVIREMVFPITRNEKIVAIIGVGNKETDYQDDDVAYASRLADLIWDITEGKRAEEKLRESEERFRTLVNSMDDVVYTLDTQQRHTGVYGDWTRRAGLTPEYFLGKTAREIFGPETSQNHEEANSRALTGNTVVYEWSIESNDGMIHYQTSVSPLKNAKGTIVGIVGLGRDITERKRSEEAIQQVNESLKERLVEIENLQEKLREQVIRDPLTDLFNRRYLQETLEREVSRAKRDEQPVSLIIMDIDYFKRINDSYGHSAGDEMLRAIGKLIKASIRLEDIPCRYGGEEFLIVMPGASLQVAQKRARTLHEKITSLRVKYDSHELQVTISLGVATFPIHGSSGEETLIRADRALYQAKHDGRNRISVFQDSLRTPHP